MTGMVQPVERATDDRAVDEMAETRMERAWLMTEGAFDPGYFGSTLPQARGEVSSVDVGRIIPPFLGISTTLLVVWIVGD